MKKIIITCALFFALLGITSCNQEQIETYQDTNNIYFSAPAFIPNANEVLKDSTGFSFAFDNTTIERRVYPILIRVQGKVSNVDRTVKVVVDPLSTAIEGTHFSLPNNIVIGAGRQVDTIAVTVNRTLDMKLKTFTLVLNLEENEFFTTKMESVVTNILTHKTMSYTRFKLSFDDRIVQPLGWIVGYLGTFTPKKFFLMCDLLKIDPAYLNQQAGGEVLTTAELRYYAAFMKRYLADQKASGNTIYEDDGSEMTFP